MHELHTLKRPSKKQVCPELWSIEIYSFFTYFILTGAVYFSREALEIGNTSCAVTGTKSSIRWIPVNHMTLLSVV